MTTRAPSVKTLMALKDMTRLNALFIRRVIKADREGLLDIASELDEHRREVPWQRYNYINHRTPELRAELLDTILETYGVEYLFKSTDGLTGTPEGIHDEPILVYLNAGDSYATTLLKYRGRWQVGDWGSIAERYL